MKNTVSSLFLPRVSHLLLLQLVLVAVYAENNTVPQPSVVPPTPPTDAPSQADPNKRVIDYIRLAITITCIVIGLIWVFLGNLLFSKNVTFPLAGIVVFYFISFELFSAYLPGKLPFWAYYVVGAVFALIGGTIFFILYAKLKIIAHFLFGTLTGMLLATLVFAFTPLSTLGLLPWHQLLIILGVGLVGGILCAIKPTHIIFLVIGTPFNGAFLIGNIIDGEWVQSGVSDLLVRILREISTPNVIDMTWKVWVLLAGIAVLAFVGVGVQYVSIQKEDEDQNNEEKLNLLTSADSY